MANHALISIPPQASAAAASRVALAALRALHAELCLFPKPGLVSKIDNGSHHDMHPALFVKSLFSLRHYFAACYAAGYADAPFEQLQTLGLQAEARMMRATGGVNTHRGAIFNLGILSAAIARRDACATNVTGAAGGDTPASLSKLVIDHWAAAICMADADALPVADSNGARACRTFAVGGARGEAAAGFPHVFQIGLPALHAVLRDGGTREMAECQAFFAIMQGLDDTNLLHRGGATGLAYARDAAAAFLRAGGVFATTWRQHALAIHHAFVERRLSPGGSADLIAATLFVDRACGGTA